MYSKIKKYLSRLAFSESRAVALLGSILILFIDFAGSHTKEIKLEKEPPITFVLCKSSFLLSATKKSCLVVLFHTWAWVGVIPCGSPLPRGTSHGSLTSAMSNPWVLFNPFPLPTFVEKCSRDITRSLTLQAISIKYYDYILKESILQLPQ